MMERPAVSIGAAALYDDDMQLLRSPSAWLNDAVITLWMEHLAASAPPPRVALVHCAAVALARFEDDDADRAAALAPLRLHEAALVLLPVNDCADPTAVAGGSHWALLAFDRARHDEVRLFDSGHLDVRAARDVWARFWPLIAAPSPSSGQAARPPPPRISDGGCAKQADVHSCGVYVCAVAGALVAEHAKAAAPGAAPPSTPRLDPRTLTPGDVAAYRRHMLDVALRHAVA